MGGGSRQGDTVDWLSPGFGYGGSSLVRKMDSSLRGGMSGGKGGGSQAFDRAQLPPGWRNTTENLGKATNSMLKDSRFTNTLSSALDWFGGLAGKGEADFSTAENALRSQAEDPTRLTNPLFRQMKEQLGGDLVERSRQMGLTSGDAGTDVTQGLSDFTNRYLTSAFEGQRAAAGGLAGIPGARGSFGSSLFTPYQATSSNILGVLGAVNGGQPASYGNGKGQTAGAAGQIGGSIISNLPALVAMFSSDSRLKKHIQTILHIGKLRIVSWIWNDDAIIVGKTPGTYETGFLAEEVAPLYPSCVMRDPAGYLRINYPLVIHSLCSESR